nr:nucleotidyltransferase family protein [Segatella baroniae]
MAGGRGTRIAQLLPGIPKPLIPIDGMPILEREIRMLAAQGFKDIILTVGYLADQIIKYFGDGSQLGVQIDYFVEEQPLGNAGALFRLRDKIGEEPFLLLNADAAFHVDFNRMLDFHKKHGGLVTLFTHPNSHPYDSGLIIADADGKVEKWLAKEDEHPQWYDNRVNAGLHIPMTVDQRLFLTRTKASDFKEIRICDHPGVAKGTSGFKHVIDLVPVKYNKGVEGSVEVQGGHQSVSTR